MLSISGSIKCAIIVFSVTILSSCSVLIAPIAPLAANYMLSNHSKHLQAIEPKTMILIPQQLATIKRIAVMPLENLFGDERIALIKMWPKDLAVSGVMFASNKKTGRIISEYIEENLLELGTIDVVERSRLNLVLKEQSLMQSGLGGDYIPEIVAATAGADAILLGAIVVGAMYMPDRSSIMTSYRLHIKVRLVDTRNGKVLLAISDRQHFASLNPDDVVELNDFTAQRVAKFISDSIKHARKKFPNATPPTGATYLKTSATVESSKSGN